MDLSPDFGDRIVAGVTCGVALIVVTVLLYAAIEILSNLIDP